MKCSLPVLHKVQAFCKKANWQTDLATVRDGGCAQAVPSTGFGPGLVLLKVLRISILWNKDVVFTCLATKPLVISQSSSAPRRELSVIAFLHRVLHLTNDQLCIQWPALVMQKTSLAWHLSPPFHAGAALPQTAYKEQIHRLVLRETHRTKSQCYNYKWSNQKCILIKLLIEILHKFAWSILRIS